MKTLKHFVMVVVLSALSIPTVEAWPWSSDEKLRRIDQEIQRRIQVEQKLTAQEAKAARWQITGSVFAVGCLLFLIIGTALGSKGRQHAEQRR